LLAAGSQPSFDCCIDLAFSDLLQTFCHDILELRASFPQGSTITPELRGPAVPFYSGLRRFPTPITWDPQQPDPRQVEFLYNAANLYALMLSLPPFVDSSPLRAVFRTRLIGRGLTAPVWQPSPPAKTEPDPDAAAASPDQQRFEQLLRQAQSYDLPAFQQRAAASPHSSVIQPAVIDVDDDSNFQLDYITAWANLRAFNFGIPAASRHTTRIVAGKITPTLATAAAAITGLSALEFLKLKLPLEIESFSNHDFNLHWSDFQAYEPSAPARAMKAYDPIEMTEVPPVPDGFTVWDHLVIDSGDMTLQEFLDFFPGCHHGVVPCYIAANSNPLPGQPGLLFTSFGPPSMTSLVERFKCMKMSQVYLEQYGPLPACGYLSLQISATLNDEPVAIPSPVLFKFAEPFPTP
jgi:ubiquitin-activating enzyme E1